MSAFDPKRTCAAALFPYRLQLCCGAPPEETSNFVETESGSNTASFGQGPARFFRAV
jgi:hypothetical protein